MLSVSCDHDDGRTAVCSSELLEVELREEGEAA